MPGGPEGLRLHAFVLRVLLAIGLTALALFLWRVIHVLLLVFGAGLLAILLDSAAGPLRRRAGLSPTLALATVVAGGLLVLGTAFWLFGAELVAQAGELAERLPEAWAAARRWLQQYQIGRSLLQRLHGAVADLEPLAAKLPHWAAMASAALLELVLVVFGGVYLAADPRRYRSGLLKLFPPAARQRVGDTVDAAALALRHWLLAQLVVMIVVGSLTGLGLWLIGIPAPLALGLLAGLLEFVPYVGPIVAAVPGLLLSLAVGPLGPLYAAAVYLASSRSRAISSRRWWRAACWHCRRRWCCSRSWRWAPCSGRWDGFSPCR